MKRFLSFILTIILSITTVYSFSQTAYADDNAAKWPAAPNVFAKTAVLIDASTGTVLYDKKCHKKMYPASITKIMTALLTIENCDMDEKVVFSDYAVNSLQYGDANIGCQIGEEMTVKDCLYALMLQSANEVATALAEHISGSVEKFSNLMNERAKQAGATDTHFANANGLHDENHYVTAYDMAMITRAASQYDTFNEIVNTTEYTVPANNKRSEPAVANQRHKMVWEVNQYYYDGIIGGKTGYTDQSGTTLVTYAKRNGMTLIAVVLKSDGTHVYEDTTALLDYGFNNFNLVSASDNDSRFKNSANSALKSPFSETTDSIYIDKSSSVIIPKKVDFSQLSISVDFNSEKDSFATISYKLDNRDVGSAKLIYSSTKNQQPDTETTVESETTKTDNSSKQSFKIPSFVFPTAVVIIILIIIFILINNHKKKLNRIRAMKRQRNR